MHPKHIILSCLAHILLLAGCAKDPNDITTAPVENSDEEVIHSMHLKFVNAAQPTDSLIYHFVDNDGIGGNPPSVFDTLRFPANTHWHCSIELGQIINNQLYNIHEEVLEEAIDHLFCFEAEAVAIGILRTDSDGVYEIGLQSDWSIQDVSAGTLRIQLKHQPGIKDGTCEPGDTDLDLTFRAIIE
jgi:hypothetical protein